MTSPSSCEWFMWIADCGAICWWWWCGTGADGDSVFGGGSTSSGACSGAVVGMSGMWRMDFRQICLIFGGHYVEQPATL